MCKTYKETITTCDKCFKLIVKQFITTEIEDKPNKNKYKILFDLIEEEEEQEEKNISCKINNKTTRDE